MKILMVSDYQLPAVACIFLVFAMAFYWISLIFPKNMFFFQLGKIFVLFSNLLFALTLLIRWIEENYFPLSNLYESLIFLSWGISTIHLFIEFQTKSRLIGCIVSPILFFIAGFSSLTLPTDMQKALPLVPSLQSNWLMMHVTMMMISYATLIVGSLLSLLYLAFLTFDSSANKSSLPGTSERSEQESESPSTSTSDGLPKEVQRSIPNLVYLQTKSTNVPLKGDTHRPPMTNLNLMVDGSVYPEEKQKDLVQEQSTSDGLPSEVQGSAQNTKKIFSSSKQALLQTVDLWSYRIIGLGFPFLTIGIISGAVWANEAWGSYWSWDPKETWAFITWLIFAFYLHTRLQYKWEGAKSASVASIGFFIIWICYLGVNLLGQGLHSYGWINN
jgi:cytochrome c-type biogenesis protein CcsB